MTDKHDLSFFGQKSAMFISSPGKATNNIFVKCIRVKSDNSWEKPSKGEGKTISLKLEEMLGVLQVLNEEVMSFKAYHQKGGTGEGTSILVGWESDALEKLWFNIGSYKKPLVQPQVELLRRYIEHLINEKVEFSTVTTFKDS